MDASDVGRYGTLKFMKRTDPSAVAAMFPIDDEEVTFGRDLECDVRLYYDSVSAVHCKIVFQDRKAFLVVLGTNGLLIDDSPVFPSANAFSPTTISLSTNSKIEIHKKVFIFQYPPKELRPILLATPARKGKVRMSMIQSAQVFTPHPSNDPRENLRVLQSPVKDKGGDIVLVDGDHPRVTQEDKDLIILEDVPQTPRALSTPSPSKPAVFPPRPPVYQTPRPLRPPRPSLHRAVLIRSAQRTAMRAEMERETEEEREVEEAVVGILEDDEDEDMEEGFAEEEMEQDEEQSAERPSAGTSWWQKPLEAVRGLSRSLSRSPERQLQQEEHDGDKDMVGTEELDHDTTIEHNETEDNDNDYNPVYPPLPTALTGPSADSQPQFTTPPPRLRIQPPEPGQQPRFMTPQAQRPPPGARVFTPPHTAVRLDFGKARGDGPRRVKIEAPWKVKDIEVVMDNDEDESVVSPRKREKVDEAERKAILERRRSAVSMPDTFFGGQIPGVRKIGSVSPVKAAALEDEEGKGEEEEDARTLLEKVKVANEDMSRRRSERYEQLAATPSPVKRGRGRFSLIAPGAVPIMELPGPGEDEDGDVAMSDIDEANDEPEQADQGGSAPRPRPTTPLLDLRHIFTQKSQPALQTPTVRGVRDLFIHNGPKDNSAATPKMDGVKNMFLVQKEMPSAVLEGVGELLATPEGWRARSAPEADLEEGLVAPVEVEEVQEEEDARTKNARSRRTPAAKAKSTRANSVPKTAAPARKRNARAPVSGASQMADDEATPHNGELRNLPGDSDEEGEVGTKAKVVAKKPRVLRGRRVQDPEASTATASQGNAPVTEHVAELEPVPEGEPVKSMKTSATRSKTQTGKTRANTSEPEGPAPARKTIRRGRSAAPESTTDSERPARPKAATRTRGTKTVPIDIDHDELDSLERPVSPEEAPDAKGKLYRRGAKVKEEETEEEAAKAVQTTGARTRKTPARGRAKDNDATAVVVADESSGVEGNGDKENAPETGGASAEEAPAPRKRGRPAKAKVKSEEPPAEIPKTTTTRATRARAAKKA